MVTHAVHAGYTMGKFKVLVFILGLSLANLLGTVFIRLNWISKSSSKIIVPDQYLTIQEAINHAVEGDAIFVRAGTYCEHVIINKSISIMGEDKYTTIIDGERTGSVICTTADNVTITSFTIQNSGRTINGTVPDAGISVSHVSNCNASGNILADNYVGIFVRPSRSTWFANNVIIRNHIGIDINNQSTYNIISGNNLQENNVSIHIYYADFNVFFENNLTDSPVGVIARYSSNNTFSENEIRNGLKGMILNGADFNSVSKNIVSDLEYGIQLKAYSDHNFISENNITNCSYAGIDLDEYACDNSLSTNPVVNSEVGIGIGGWSDNNTISSNTVAGGRFGVRVSNSRYTEISGNIVDHNYGSDMWDAGIRLDYAGYSRIHSNLITDNWRGILLHTQSPYVSICDNNITDNEFGVRLNCGGSNYVNISRNVVMNNRGYGVGLTGFGGASNYATISRNLIVNSSNGIALGQYSNYNMILQNNISQNGYGFYIEYSTQNTIQGNNIVDNDQQVYVSTGSVNNWDGDYPAGGNYWSDYYGIDLLSSPYQNETGSDGIGDTPYVINPSNRDNYPLMKLHPWDDPHDIGITMVTTSKTVAGQGYLLQINVRIFNYGLYAESFNVTTYFDEANIHTLADITLTSRNSTTLTIPWNTTGVAKGNYTIKAHITPLSEETDTADNTHTDGWIVVTIPGDVDGDGDVDIYDVVLITSVYGSSQGDPSYSPNSDIDGDGDVDIYDVVLCTSRYGQKDP